MNAEQFESAPRPEELQGTLRCAVEAIRAVPSPSESEQRASEQVRRWAAALGATVGLPSPVPGTAGRVNSGTRTRWLRPRGQRVLWSAVAATVALVVGYAFFPGSGTSGNLLAEVFQAFDRAPAYHFFVKTLQSPGEDAGRTDEIWAVRNVGRREEIRTKEKLTAVVTDNLRWLLRWDIGENHVIAYPSRMADPKRYCEMEDSELFMGREKCLQWAEERKATIQFEKDRMDEKDVEKAVISWPGGEVDDCMAIWFDPRTHRPVKVHVNSKSFAPAELISEYEVLIDYPAPESIAADRLAIQVPREARLEIEDSQLGRYIRSEGRKGPWLGQ